MKSIVLLVVIGAICVTIGMIVLSEANQSVLEERAVVMAKPLIAEKEIVFDKKLLSQNKTFLDRLNELAVEGNAKIFVFSNLEQLPELFHDVKTSSENGLGSMLSGNSAALVLSTPLERLKQMYVAQQYKEVLVAFDKADWYGEVDQAMEIRILAVLELSKKYLEDEHVGEAIFLLEHQLNMKANAARIYPVLAQAYTDQGRIHDALRLLQEGGVIIDDREQARQLLAIQSSMVNQHLNFLKKNGHWLELIKFVESDPIPGSDDYYRYKLEAARAYIELFQLDQAEEQLVLAAFDPSLEGIVLKLKEQIAALRLELQQQAKEDQIKDAIHIPIMIRGDAIFVKVQVNEKVEATLLLDTGASITHLSSRILKELGRDRVYPDGERIFITASGKMKAPVARVEKFQLNEAGVSHLLIAFSDIFATDSGVDGLLGMNFLKFYNFNFDLDKGFLVLSSKEI